MLDLGNQVHSATHFLHIQSAKSTDLWRCCFSASLDGVSQRVSQHMLIKLLRITR